MSLVLALDDKAVSDLMSKERFETAKEAFAAGNTPQTGRETDGDMDTSWVYSLTKDASGRFEKTINNAVIILENDPLLKGRIVTDEFASCGMALGRVPWDERDEKRRWKDVDDAGFYRYMETFYGLTGREKLDNALLLVSSKNRINDVKRYSAGVWMGTARSAWKASWRTILGQRTTSTPMQSCGSPCVQPWHGQLPAA